MREDPADILNKNGFHTVHAEVLPDDIFYNNGQDFMPGRLRAMKEQPAEPAVHLPAITISILTQYVIPKQKRVFSPPFITTLGYFLFQKTVFYLFID
jgi:hypothetical protein